MARCGIARTRDLKAWERLDDLKTPSAQQRNCVLHPEFVDGKYAFYTRPQDSFIEAGSGGGIGWGLASNMEHAVIEEESIIDRREYHTINEVKNGLGPAPLKTEKGWLHLAHGVRNTAAGLRYVLYCFLCGLNTPHKVIAKPGGYFLAPMGEERIGDVSNVAFSNGWGAARRRSIHLLRRIRHAHECRHHDGGATARLRCEYPPGRSAQRGVRAAAGRVDREEPEVPAPVARFFPEGE